MARLSTCLAILVVISVILQQQPVTGFPRPFRSFLKAQSRDLDESNDEDNDEAEDMAGYLGLNCFVQEESRPKWCWTDRGTLCDNCSPATATVLGSHYHCGIGCDNNLNHCKRCIQRGE